jgi:hypothetical protein
MAIEVETRTGRCATHGTVEGTRDMPKSGFPWAYNAIRRMMARRKPYVCPECGAPVETA